MDGQTFAALRESGARAGGCSELAPPTHRRRDRILRGMELAGRRWKRQIRQLNAGRLTSAAPNAAFSGSLLEILGDAPDRAGEFGVAPVVFGLMAEIGDAFAPMHDAVVESREGINDSLGIIA